MISIDIDSTSAVAVYKTIWKGLRLGLHLDVVEVSPSGSGFHVIFKDDVSPISNIIYRALLEDDPYRLRHSIIRMFMNSQVDICFWAKAEGVSKVVYPSSENFINLEEIEKAETVEEVVKLAEASKLNELKVKSYATVIPFNGSELKDKIDKVINDIMDKDKSFRARIYPSYLPNFDFVLVAFSPDKDTAEKRGMWLVKKAFPEGHYYWIKEMVQK
jgi:hypothetical protein